MRRKLPPKDPDRRHSARIADFINAVGDKHSVQPTFEDGLADQIVLDAVEKSARTRKWVAIGK